MPHAHPPIPRDEPTDDDRALLQRLLEEDDETPSFELQKKEPAS